MPISTFRTLALLALLVPATAAAGAWTEDAPFATPAATLLEEAAAVESDASVVVLLHEDVYRYDAEGRETHTLRRVYVVRSPSAVEAWGHTEASWAPWIEARPEIAVRVVSADGTEHRLDGADIPEAVAGGSDPTMYSDVKELRAPLPGIGPGSVVEEITTMRDHSPLLSGGAGRRIPVASWVPVERMRIRVEAPQGRLRWRVEGLDVRPRKERSQGIEAVELVVDDVEASDRLDDFLPPDVAPWPHLEFSTAPSWEDIAAAYHAQIAGRVDAAGLAALVEEVGAGEPSRREKVDRAYRIARDRIRYTAVSFGDAAVVPYAPAEVLARGFGDCKDKATLMVALLREVGVEARLALLQTGSRLDLSPEYPGPNRFNHAIVYVPGESLWADPTSRMSPLGRLPASDHGRYALIVAPTGGELLRTPRPASADAVYREERVISLATSGAGDVAERTTGTGWIEENLRWEYADDRPEDLEESFAGYGSDVYSAEALEAWTLTSVRDLEVPFALDIAFDGAWAATSGSTDAAVWARPGALTLYVPSLLTAAPGDADPLADRKHPVTFHPFRTEIAYQMKAPVGFTFAPERDGFTRRFGPVELSENWKVDEDGTVELTWIFDSGEAVLAPREARELREALRTLLAEQAVRVRWVQEGRRLHQTGEHAAALAHYDQLIALHPDVATYHTWRASLLLEARLTDAALASARRAVEVAPEDPATWKQLALVQMHDRFGRELRVPFDRQGAIASLERALAIDPADGDALFNLALLYEHSAAGMQFGAGADIEKAVDLHRRRLEHVAAPNVNLALGLLHLGRFEELAETVGAWGGTEFQALRIAGLAGTHGARHALAELGGLGLDDATEKEVAQLAGGYLIRHRQYEVAGDWLATAASSTPDPIQSRAAATMCRTARHWETLDEEKDELAAFAARAVHASLGGRLAELREVYHPDLLEVLKGQTLTDSLVAGPKVLASTGLPLDVLVDLTMGGAAIRSEGSARSGWRLELTAPAGQRDVFYVVKDAGALTVRSAGTIASEVGAEALARLRSGDVRGARQWLAWAAADLHAGDDPGRWDAPPFIHLYRDDSRDGLEIAAAALMATTRPAEAIAILEPARTGAEGERALHVDRAIAAAAVLAQDGDALLAAARRMREVAPDHRGPAGMEVLGLVFLGRYEEARPLAEVLRDRWPGQILELAAVLQEAGDVAALRALLEERVTQPGASAMIYNDLAWLLVETEPVRAIELATRGTMAEAQPSEALLHTLAAAHAMAGDPVRAAEVMGIALQPVADSAAVGSHWWLVVGLVAESYGLPDEARAAYERVDDVSDPSGETLDFARRRLEAL